MSLPFILTLLALIAFVIATVGGTVPYVSLVPLGLALWVAAGLARKTPAP